MAFDNKLAAFDISAVFAMLDIPTIERRLEHSFGVTGASLRWIKSYLSNQTQLVKVDKARKLPETCSLGVTQGSLIGQLLFTLYVASLANVIALFGFEFHQYADDIQLYIAFNQGGIMIAKLCDVEQCCKAVHDCFLLIGLALNPDKTKVLLVGSAAKLRHIHSANAVNIAGADVSLVDSAKSLRVTTDSRYHPTNMLITSVGLRICIFVHCGISGTLCLLTSRNMLPARFLVHG